MNKSGSGLGHFSASVEKAALEATIKNFAERANVLGKLPGTHTLGKEFKTPKKES